MARFLPPATLLFMNRAKPKVVARRNFGPLDVVVPRVGQGTWQMGGAHRRGEVDALVAGIQLGLTHLDTAELYGGAEEIVADAIDRCGRPREELFIISKVLPQNAT